MSYDAKAHREGRCDEDCPKAHYPPSPSPVEFASDEERLYTVIKINAYGEPLHLGSEDSFRIAAWTTRRQFEALKEFFLTSIMLDHIETDKKHKEAVE
jgi:hypothetical protein